MTKHLFLAFVFFTTYVSFGQQRIPDDQIKEIERKALMLKNTLIKNKSEMESMWTVVHQVEVYKATELRKKRMNLDDSTSGMARAVNLEEKDYEKILKKYLKTLKNLLNEEDKISLHKSQENWLKFRDSERKLSAIISMDEYSGGGTIQINIRAGKRRDITRQRVDEIFGFLSRMPYDTNFNLFSNQEIRYVSADNGLIVRDGPSSQSTRISKLNYAQKIEVIEETGIKLSIIDDGKPVSGEWVKVKNEQIQGYVFSGFLTDENLKKNITIKFNDFSVKLNNVGSMNGINIVSGVKKDTVKIALDLGISPESKYLKIDPKNYKEVEVFQQHENSISIMDEGPHCDLVDWKHFYSDWKKIAYYPSSDIFKTLKYSGEDFKKFILINLNEFKRVAKEHCGPRWENIIDSIENPFKYPSGVSISKIFLKIVLTDDNNQKTEKIIEFKIPMGC